ncbi:PAS domain S-box protein [Baaleninema sp.]|uniref:PAS domain S-box protein n=1 Tax=Baaleninema sp. TaxID=3101197 RepID=UPI003D04045C
MANLFERLEKEYARPYLASNVNLRWGSLCVLVGLILLGYAGNHYNLPLFFGVDFLFGSIAVVLVASLYGIKLGTLAGFLVSLYTIRLWGYPYAVVSFTLEAFAVGWGLRRSTLHPVVLDGLYWLLVGMPLTWVFYFQVLALPVQSTILILLKVALNGIFNALVASLLLVHTPIARWLHGRQEQLFPLRHTLFNLLVTFAIIPTLGLMVVDSRLAQQELENTVRSTLEAITTQLAAEIQIAHENSFADLNVFRQMLAAFQTPFETQFFLIDRVDRPIVRYPANAQLFDRESGETHHIDGKVYHWLPGEDLPLIIRWRKSIYYSRAFVSDLPWTIVVLAPADTFIDRLEQTYIRSLLAMLGIASVALLSASLLSRSIVRPLGKLAEVSTGLSDKLSDSSPIHWPHTSIWEFDALVGNFRAMSLTLQQKFREIQQANELLEQRVRERTQRLASTNQALNAEIHERKRIESEIRKSQQRLSMMVRQTPLAVIEWNDRGEITAWNPAAERIFGYTAEEAIGRTVAGLIIPESAKSTVLGLMDLLVQQQGGIRSTNENLTKSGKTIICEWYNAPLVDADGHFVGVASMAQNITDRRLAEEALQESERRFRDVSEAAGEYVWEINADGLYTFLADRVKDVKGYSASELIGRTPFSVMFEADVDKVRAVLNVALENRTPFKLQHRGVTPTGEVVWEDVSGVPIFDDNGRLVGYRGTGLSITERKHAEAELRQSEAQLRQKAEELQATLRELQHTQSQLVQSEKMSSLGQLVAGVAHEINNPVNFIFGNIVHAEEYSEELLETIRVYQRNYPKPTEEVREQIELADVDFLIEDFPKLIDSMKEGARRIRDIVASLRNFSRLDESEYKEADLHEGLDNSLVILHNRIKDKPNHPAIEIVKNYGEIPLVECYAGQLNQVFMNILVNAVDALEERDKKRGDSEIQENPSQIHITTKHNKNWIEIRIKDNGSGIPDKVKQQIFDPFFTTKPVGKGTGLGLSISYKIVVDKHHGKLSCFSNPEWGTEFVIEIPKYQTCQIEN